MQAPAAKSIIYNDLEGPQQSVPTQLQPEYLPHKLFNNVRVPLALLQFPIAKRVPLNVGSQTTVRVRNTAGVIIATDHIREHRPIYERT